MKTAFVTCSARAHDQGIAISVVVRNEDGKTLKRLAYVYDQGDVTLEAGQYAAMLEGIALASTLRPSSVVFRVRCPELFGRMYRGAFVPRRVRVLHSVTNRALEWVLRVRWFMWLIEEPAGAQPSD